jgi:hypothetical protein
LFFQTGGSHSIVWSCFVNAEAGQLTARFTGRSGASFCLALKGYKKFALVGYALGKLCPRTTQTFAVARLYYPQ